MGIVLLSLLGRASAAEIEPGAAAGTTGGSVIPVLVTLARFQFSPGGPDGPPIRLKAGVTYEITFRSTDVEHGVSAIPTLGIEGHVVSPGADYVVTVSPTAAQKGRYNFACTRVCGADHGRMFGAIEVEAADDPAVLWLGSGRFRVEVAWSAVNVGTAGVGQAIQLTSETGAFWFFEPSNLELMVKVLDARVVNGHFWVFYGALSDVDYTITVTDTETGAIRLYHNPQGHMASTADTAAF